MSRKSMNRDGVGAFPAKEYRIPPEVADEFEVIFNQEKESIYARHGGDPAVWTPEAWSDVQSMLEEMLLKAMSRAQHKRKRSSRASKSALTLENKN